MGTKEKEKLDKVIYSYAANLSGLEEENRSLRKNITKLEKEIKKYRNNPLIVCEVREVFKDSALIKLQNGNEFQVDVSDGCGKIKSGDFVLAEQKNLTIIKKVPASKKYDVEKFVVVEKPDMLWDVERIRKRDRMHHRVSGLNHILCKIAKKNNVIIGFSVNTLIHSKHARAKVFGRVSQNIRLCRKFGVNMAIASFAKDPHEMKSPHDIKSLFIELGMHPKEAKDAFRILEKRIENNKSPVNIKGVKTK